ncbi:MAG TPA: aldehyde dehydrogenase family protein [Lacipirellulaceae bacterium]|nr:aldehyde dehydrogenase family protein [Lacipirellulaceae bacterium]
MKMLIAGQSVESVLGRSFPVHNPATGEVIECVPQAGPEDVRLALASARKGRDIMASLPAHERSDILKRTAELIGAHLEELSQLLTAENGKTIRQCRAEVDRTRRLFEDFAEEAKRIRGDYLPMDAVPGLERMIAYTVRQPVGIVFGIVPFNYPVELFAHKIPGAIAAGCAVIVKVPELCPLALLRIGEIMLEAGMPGDGMQMLTGFPQPMGDELLTDPDVRMISFTGSVNTAKLIAGKTAGSLKKFAFELGGTDAMIVMEDADLSAAADAVVDGRLTNGAGQICCAVKRVLVQESVYTDFLNTLLERRNKINMGDPRNEDTNLGPLISAAAAEKVDAQVTESLRMGARCLAGGKRVEPNFYQPTILVDVTTEMPVMKDEVFGPVAPVLAFKDANQAVEIANDSPYGLQSSVFSSNISTALKLAHRLEVGGVVINGTCAFRPGNVPFGGAKQSGIGRESIVESVREMTEVKTIVINEAL